jgi:cellulose biosynthesis protein BcsQ
MGLVVGIVSRKGGQGKSTVAVSLAAAAVSGKRPKTLQTCNASILVDVDSQGSSSRWALDRETFAQLSDISTVAALQYPARPSGIPELARLAAAETREELVRLALENCLFPVHGIDGLSVVPSAPTVHVEDAREVVLSNLPADVVVVDTGADASTSLVRSVIEQADYLIVPTVCEPWGVDAVDMVVEQVRSCGRSDLFDRGLSIVVSMRQRNKTHDVLEASLRDSLGSAVSPVVIPRTAAIGHVAGGPQFLTQTHAMRKIAVDLWAQIFTDIQSRKVAA